MQVESHQACYKCSGLHRPSRRRALEETCPDELLKHELDPVCKAWTDQLCMMSGECDRQDDYRTNNAAIATAELGDLLLGFPGHDGRIALLRPHCNRTLPLDRARRESFDPPRFWPPSYTSFHQQPPGLRFAKTLLPLRLWILAHRDWDLCMDYVLAILMLATGHVMSDRRVRWWICDAGRLRRWTVKRPSVDDAGLQNHRL